MISCLPVFIRASCLILKDKHKDWSLPSKLNTKHHNLSTSEWLYIFQWLAGHLIHSIFFDLFELLCPDWSLLTPMKLVTYWFLADSILTLEPFQFNYQCTQSTCWALTRIYFTVEKNAYLKNTFKMPVVTLGLQIVLIIISNIHWWIDCKKKRKMY